MHQSTNGSASISSLQILNNELFSLFLLDADVFLSLASYKYLLHELLYIGYTNPQTTVTSVQITILLRKNANIIISEESKDVKMKDSIHNAIYSGS